MENFKVKTEPEINVTQEDVDDIVATALEGGINYWCRKAEVVGDYLGEYASEQISRGGTLKLYDSEEDEVYELTRDKLLDGMRLKFVTLLQMNMNLYMQRMKKSDLSAKIRWTSITSWLRLSADKEGEWKNIQ